MPGAGTAKVAFATEDTFRTLPDTPVWRQPGENIEVGDLSFENQLSRKRNPDDPRPDGSREGNLVGSFSLTFEMTGTNWYDLIFPDGTQLGDTGQSAPTATWYVSSDVDGVTQERYLEGAGVTSVTVSYNQGEAVTVDLTITYTDEPDPSGFTTPSSIDQPTKDDIVNFNGFDLDFDGATVEELQSASIEISNMIVTRRDQSRYISGMDVGGYEPSLSITAILNDDTLRSYAYGSSSAAEPLSQISETTATATFDQPSGTLSTWNLSGVQVNTQAWQDLVSADTQTADDAQAHVADITTA
jgi:hypothetical protein